MNPTNRIVLVALALAATATAANASDAARRDRIDDRQAIEAYRIQHNRATGQLTWLEKTKLNWEQHRIRQMEQYAKRDGYITRYEAQRIEAAQDAAARDIYRESHDGQVAWWKRW
jgi:hypothetical protein